MAPSCEAAVLISMCRKRSLLIFVALSQVIQHTQSKASNNHDSDSQWNQPQALASAGSALLQRQTHQTTQPQLNIHGASAQNAVQMNQGKFARAARQVPPEEILEDGVAVVWPGLGEESHAQLVQKNIQWLKKQGIPFDCWIFVYKSEKEFALNQADFEPCNIERHQGFWMSHVLEMPLNLTKMPFILHILDSIEPQADVNLKSMVQIMRANSLGEASPTFPSCPYLFIPGSPPSCPRPIMVRNASFEVGRQVDLIEYHFNMFTRDYFACLQDKIDAENTLGWGVAKLVPYLCGGSSFGSVEKNGNMGLLDHMTMKKLWAGSYNRSLAHEEETDYLSKFPDAHLPLLKVIGPLVPAADAAQIAQANQ